MQTMLFNFLIVLSLLVSNIANAHENDISQNNIVSGSFEILRNGTEFVVDSISKTGDATIITLKEVGKGASIGVKMTGKAAENVAVATGETVHAVAKGTGKSLEAAGKVVFFIPNQVAKEMNSEHK